MAGRPGAAPRGQERPARAHRGQPPRLLRALGEDLGVPGAAQGPPRRGRPAVGQAYCDAVSRWCGRRRRGTTSSTTCRRCDDGSSSTSRRRRPTGSSSSGPGACVTSSSACSCSSSCTAAPTSSLRTGTTLDGLAALSAAGYVGRDDAATLGTAYRLLRTLEHRIQLFRLRRTHLMPTADSDLRRLGRALGHRSSPAEAVVAQWRQQREVRRLHERIFYRPLLSAVARLAPTTRGSPPRPRGNGCRRWASATHAARCATSRRSPRASAGGPPSSAQLLPVMLGWFADEADPDAGLLAFRKISDELGSTHWYLRLLRDEGSAAERLAHTLARSRFAADLLEQAPESVQFLGDSAGLQPRSRDDLLRRMRRRRVARTTPTRRCSRRAPSGGPSCSGSPSPTSPAPRPRRPRAGDDRPDRSPPRGHPRGVRARPRGHARRAAAHPAARRRHGPARRRRVRATARDADVLFVHDPVDGRRRGGGPGPGARGGQGADPPARAARARPAARHRRRPAARGQERAAGALPGATAPTTAAGRWSGRRRPCCGPRRWPATRARPSGSSRSSRRSAGREDGLDGGQVREIRTLKARMEAERLPRGADRKTHFKLGHGGLSDVEWVVQLVQLRHAHALPSCARPRTMAALEAAEAAGLVDAEHAADLAAAWRLASPMRNAGVLFRAERSTACPRPARRRRHRPHPRASRAAGRARRALPPGGAPCGPAWREFNFYGSSLGRYRRAHGHRHGRLRDGALVQRGAPHAGLPPRLHRRDVVHVGRLYRPYHGGRRVFGWTGSALATAATFAFSLVSISAGPCSRRLRPPAAPDLPHRRPPGPRAAGRARSSSRSAPRASLSLVLSLVVILEFVGGPAVDGRARCCSPTSSRSGALYARAFGLTTLAAPINQAIGLASAAPSWV